MASPRLDPSKIIARVATEAQHKNPASSCQRNGIATWLLRRSSRFIAHPPEVGRESKPACLSHVEGLLSTVALFADALHNEESTTSNVKPENTKPNKLRAKALCPECPIRMPQGPLKDKGCAPASFAGLLVEVCPDQPKVAGMAGFRA